MFLKALLKLLQYCFCYSCFGFFGPEACGILAPQPRIEPAPPALEGEILTTGPEGSPELLQSEQVYMDQRDPVRALVAPDPGL